MERFMSGVVAVLWCFGMLICAYGYHTEKMLSFGFWGTLIVLSTVGYIVFLVVGYFKEAKGS